MSKPKRKPSSPRLDKLAIKWHDDERELNTRARGCIATAEVSYLPFSYSGDRRLEWLTSGGCWGIDADSQGDYLRRIEHDELHDLRDHLGHFGIVPSDRLWNQLVRKLYAGKET